MQFYIASTTASVATMTTIWCGNDAAGVVFSRKKQA